MSEINNMENKSEVNDTLENFDLEEYIKDLSPELQEKARACKSIDELIKLAGENRIPLPDNALEAAAGGKGIEKPSDPCPKRSDNAPHGIKFDHIRTEYYVYVCRYCGKTFNCLTMQKETY